MERGVGITRRDLLTGTLRGHGPPSASARAPARAPGTDQAGRDHVASRPRGDRDETVVCRGHTAPERAPDVPAWARAPEDIARDMDDLSGIEEP
jgi:hypothetical protein